MGGSQPDNSQLEAYDYDLPAELVAQYPLKNRVDARLLVVDRSDASVTHFHVRDLPEILRPGDSLVVNNTRVVPARLVGVRESTGGRWEGLFLMADSSSAWQILCKTRGHLQSGEWIAVQDAEARVALRLRMIQRGEAGQWVVRPDRDGPAMELLEQAGRIPLPHYIRGGEMEDSDRQRYQTVFAQMPGAVAAPTAGLHFTEELIAKLVAKDVLVHHVTLHVGMDTFRPITATRLDEHVMHSEWGQIDAATVEQLRARRAAGGRIVAVGTTSVRVLESAATSGELAAWSGPTELFIRPPYQFRGLDALMTNFHLPRTTLLVLVSALAGNSLIKKAYQEAIREQYRFYSYGDAMLIL